MARSVRNVDTELRDYLLAAAVDFRELMSRTLEGYRIANGETVWDHLSGRIDSLLDGKAVRFHRFELPDDHHQYHAGNPCDMLVLGEDDTLYNAD